MPAFAKIGDIKGAATDQDHKDWTLIDSLSSPILRSIPEGAKDQQRSRGETTLGDVILVRQLDKSSTKLAEACAKGTFFPLVQIELCTTVKGKQQPYLVYKLTNVIITSYSFHGVASGNPIPSEQVHMNCTAAEWNYIIVDPNTGDPQGNVPGKYEPGTGKGGS